VLTAFSAVWSGTAYADPDQGPSINHSGSAGRSTASGQIPAGRTQIAVQQDAEDFEAFAAAVAKARLGTGHDMSSAAQQAVLGPGGPVPTVGMGGLVPNARVLAAYIADTYPGVLAIGGVRSDPLPDHPSGHAIDIMIGSDMGLGDTINADVQSQAGRFNICYTLWRVANHFNHVHVTVN
jgi:hypothetical protein